jgi:hypothetical protein
MSTKCFTHISPLDNQMSELECLTKGGPGDSDGDRDMASSCVLPTSSHRCQLMEGDNFPHY